MKKTSSYLIKDPSTIPMMFWSWPSGQLVAGFCSIYPKLNKLISDHDLTCAYITCTHFTRHKIINKMSDNTLKYHTKVVTIQHSSKFNCIHIICTICVSISTFEIYIPVHIPRCTCSPTENRRKWKLFGKQLIILMVTINLCVGCRSGVTRSLATFVGMCVLGATYEWPMLRNIWMMMATSAASAVVVDGAMVGSSDSVAGERSLLS